MTSGQETERVYSYNPGARTGQAPASSVNRSRMLRICNWHYYIIEAIIAIDNSYLHCCTSASLSGTVHKPAPNCRSLTACKVNSTPQTHKYTHSLSFQQPVCMTAWLSWY